MYLADNKKQLKDFAKAVAVPVGLTDNTKWPVRSGSVIFPVRNIFVRDFVNHVEASGIIGKPQEWKKAFDGPTQLWRMSHHLVNGLLDVNTDKRTIAKRILMLLEGISALCNDNYFETVGTHRIMTEEDVHALLSVTQITEKKHVRKFLHLSGLLWAYSETNFFVAHELTCEYHGAYPLPSGGYAVVRDFKNLKPSQLWENRNFNGLPAYIRVVTFHDNTLDIKFDVYNNLFDDEGTMTQSLIGGYAFADKQLLSEKDIMELTGLLADKITRFTEEVNNTSRGAIARKYMEIFWYRKKSLTDYMGIGWKPDANLYTVLENGLATGPPKKATEPKSTVMKNLVEQLAIDFDFSEYTD
ncbi:MAG: hypothetical protein FWH37_08725 [Candidatus Bathyarchaeota archaeon]|nr:hypothetical protein [Candidatus Termiticorpusculum sp.]